MTGPGEHATEHRLGSYETVLPVAAHEPDAYAELPAVALLRRLQEAASAASAAVGFDRDWYAAAGAVWLIRRTILEVRRPVHYPDELRVTTWVSDMRRVRSQREYEVRSGRDGAVVAAASSDWVYVDTRRGTPLQPPIELQRALMPGGLVAQPRPRSRDFHPPQNASRDVRRVEWADLDSVAHVNNAHYVLYCGQSLLDALDRMGWRPSPGIAGGHLRITGVDMEYFDAALYDDRLETIVWTVAPSESRFSSHHKIERGGKRILQAVLDWQWSEGALPTQIRTAVAGLS